MSGAKVDSMAKRIDSLDVHLREAILTVTTATFTAELVDEDVGRLRNDSYERAKIGSRTHS
jgi:hypothetical protein